MADMGYDVSDYTDIDPIFGTLADSDAMVTRAHELGLKVIIDQVLSHSSSEHPFFKEPARPHSQGRPVVWAAPKYEGRRPTIGCRCSVAARGKWEPRRSQYYLAQLPGGAAGFQLPQPRGAGLAALHHAVLARPRCGRVPAGHRGIDFHDKLLRDDSADFRKKGAAGSEPLPDAVPRLKEPAGELGVLERMRALLDEYEARALVGEICEAITRSRMIGDTATGRRLHKAIPSKCSRTRLGGARPRQAGGSPSPGAPGG